MGSYIIPILVVLQLVLIFVIVYFEHIPKRTPKKYPFISFIIPSYNSANYLEDTIKSIKESYNYAHEILLVNDCSKDNTNDVVKKLKEKYDFIYLQNKTNLGKAKSVNYAYSKSKGKLIFVIDSDVIINKKSVYDMISRLENPRVGLVSSRPTAINKGFWGWSQTMEYSMLSVFATVYSLKSAITMWGCCFCIKRKIFEEVGLLPYNVLSEDGELALRVGELGYKVKEGTYPVLTYVPDNFKQWYKQKLRWATGGIQSFVTHIKFLLLHPVFIVLVGYGILLFIISVLSFNVATSVIGSLYSFYQLNSALSFSLFFSTFYNTTVFSGILESILFLFLGAFFSLPYLYFNYRNLFKKPLLILFVFPYSFIYFPLFVFVGTLGLFYGTYKYFTLKKDSRGW